VYALSYVMTCGLTVFPHPCLGLRLAQIPFNFGAVLLKKVHLVFCPELEGELLFVRCLARG
jgi:hypothetical protein